MHKCDVSRVYNPPLMRPLMGSALLPTSLDTAPGADNGQKQKPDTKGARGQSGRRRPSAVTCGGDSSAI